MSKYGFMEYMSGCQKIKYNTKLLLTIISINSVIIFKFIIVNVARKMLNRVRNYLTNESKFSNITSSCNSVHRMEYTMY